MMKSHTRKAAFAFTLVELLVVIAIIAILAGLILPALSKAKDKAQNVHDFNNTKQIMLAMNMYTTDNEERLPHPSWGNGGTGLDNWCYSTAIMSKHAGPISPDRLQIQLSNQVEAFKQGQLAPYLDTQKVLFCPKDAVESRGSKKALYLERPIKITSYTWNGCAIFSPTGPDNEIPHKITAIPPMAILQWEFYELFPAAFGDVGNLPPEGISQRHAGGRAKDGGTDVGGRATVGHVSGSAINLGYRKYYEMAGPPPSVFGGNSENISIVGPLPNDLWWAPGFAKGGAEILGY